jgi:hypothetical protein
MSSEFDNLNIESFSELLQELSKYINVEKMIESGSYSRFHHVIQQLNQLKHLLPNGSLIINDLAALIKCSVCLNEKPSVFLSCDHNYCISCFGSLIKSFEVFDGNEEEFEGFIKCELCQSKIEESKFSHLYPN